jgi:hypothetical protein
MPHRFRIMIQDRIVTYSRYEDIPDRFDHVIEFSPEIPPPPHNKDQHREIDAWNDRLATLMEKEHAGSS